MRFTSCLMVFAWVALGVHASEIGSDGPNFDERIAAQRVIEAVYWSHRIWPQDNPGTKPPLEQVLPESAIRLKVDDSLRKSAALASFWDRPVTSAQLFTEVERMQRETRAPEVLWEIFDALGRDPKLIAETLGRQILADRLVRDWYSQDPRFHSAARLQAESAASHLAGRPADSLQKAEGAKTHRSELRIDDLGDEDWSSLLVRLARLFGVTAPDRIPVGRVSGLFEDADAFRLVAVERRDATSISVVTASWPKVSFDVWWTSVRDSLPTDPAPAPITERATALPDGPVGSCTAGTWKDTGDMPEARGFHTAIWTGSEMLVWGGNGYTGDLQTGGIYNPATNTWRTMSTLGAPAPRNSHTAVWTGSKMIVFGGAYGWLNTGGRYDPVADTWLPTSTVNAPSPRRYHTAVWAAGRMIVWGGETTGATPTNTGGRYDPDLDTWTATSVPSSLEARADHTAVWSSRLMLVWGGYGERGNLDTGGRYDPATDGWTKIASVGRPSARAGHTAVWTGTLMVVWGATSDRSGGRYNPASDTWTATSLTNAPQARDRHTAVWVGSGTGARMVVWGGRDMPPYNFINTGGRYDPVMDIWTATRTEGAPSGRVRHSAVAAGNEMIVWGCRFIDEFRNIACDTGGRYSLGNDTWVATRVGGQAPSLRNRHTAVWTGSEMAIWGGFDGVSYKGDGAAYDPATASWRALAQVGSPSARQFHKAVWTGTRMLVWGGGDNVGVLGDGARWEPAGNAWSSISALNAPAARANHSAVWTGTRMAVWGGEGPGGGMLGTGSLYELAADAWTGLPNTDAPSPRLQHQAVWTGTHMIIWGGSTATGLTNTGAQIVPGAQNWTPLSTVGAPSARTRHAAVWTGSRMFVWGGLNGSALSDGGLYDGNSGTWMATPPTGAPSARYDHTAVWTGREAIVWGGTNTPTGASFAPATLSWTPTSTSGAPSARSLHTAIWTGNEMIVWGGGYLRDGGALCACSGGTVSTWYPDADGDGRGVDTASVASCTQPPGYSAVGGDCYDADPTVWAAPQEARNLRFETKTDLYWDAPANAGGTVQFYDLLRSNAVDDFSAGSAGCLAADTSLQSSYDPTLPYPGPALYYLVRSENACGNTLGKRSDQTERQGMNCPP